jgi:hypothetical protein
MSVTSRAPQIRWLGRGIEGLARGNAREFIHSDTQPGHLQPQNGTNHQLIKQFDDPFLSYRFEVNLETDNEVRAARVDCWMPEFYRF